MLRVHRAPLGMRPTTTPSSSRTLAYCLHGTKPPETGCLLFCTRFVAVDDLIRHNLQDGTLHPAFQTMGKYSEMADVTTEQASSLSPASTPKWAWSVASGPSSCGFAKSPASSPSNTSSTPPVGSNGFDIGTRPKAAKRYHRQCCKRHPAGSNKLTPDPKQFRTIIKTNSDVRTIMFKNKTKIKIKYNS